MWGETKRMFFNKNFLAAWLIACISIAIGQTYPSLKKALTCGTFISILEGSLKSQAVSFAIPVAAVLPWSDSVLQEYKKMCIRDSYETQVDDRHILFEFHCKDTGVGMSKEFQNHIFEPFTQETGGARSVYGGTGLGMPITKKLVEKMGGTIKFESEKNVGTTFMVQLPFLISADMKQAESQEDDVSIEGMRILLAEDNELNMEIAEFLLTNAGAEIIRASNGKEAVEAFTKSGFGEVNVIPVSDTHLYGLRMM